MNDETPTTPTWLRPANSDLRDRLQPSREFGGMLREVYIAPDRTRESWLAWRSKLARALGLVEMKVPGEISKLDSASMERNLSDAFAAAVGSGLVQDAIAEGERRRAMAAALREMADEFQLDLAHPERFEKSHEQRLRDKADSLDQLG